MTAVSLHGVGTSHFAFAEAHEAVQSGRDGRVLAHALHSPRAQNAGKYTVEGVLASRMIADALPLRQCCPTSDVVEVHDAFTIGEIVTTEALGIAAPGEGGKAAASGVTALGGALLGLVETMGGGVSVLDGNACVVTVLEAP